MNRFAAYFVLFGLVIGCRSAMVRGQEDGCEDGMLEGAQFAERDKAACVEPDPLREMYGLRGCGTACNGDTFRESHQSGWEECYAQAYAANYPEALYDPDDCGNMDTAVDTDDQCAPLAVGSDLSLRRRTVLEQDVECRPIDGTQMVTSAEEYEALLHCDVGQTAPDPQIDWFNEDAFVQYGVFANLGQPIGVYDDGAEIYLLSEVPCPPMNPPPPFRDLRIFAVPKGTVVEFAQTCRTAACD